MKIEMIKAKKKIATLWFIFSGVILLLIMIQSIMGRFETKSDEAWGWILPTIIPTLSLILSIFIVDIRNTRSSKIFVDIFYYRLTISFSAFYLLTVLLIILLQPFTGTPIITLMKNSNIFLGPFQGLVSSSMVFFFFKES